MIASHRQWLRDEVEFNVGTVEEPNEYGIPMGSEKLYRATASITVLGSKEDGDPREVQTTRWQIVIEPPEYTEIPPDTMVSFRGITAKVETIELKYFQGKLDRLRVVAREIK